MLSKPAVDEQATQIGARVPGKNNALPNGTRIGEFEVTSLIGVGGFGIVYLAQDHSLKRTVALKEYMPASFAARADDFTVHLLSSEHQETFAAGLKSFVNEAHMLAQFDNPSLVKVYRFWEGNGTAYMVMPFYEGVTLKARLARMGRPPDEAWLKNFLTQILQALDIIHAKQCFHRDIAPDNILMLEGDRPVLLDFGAARRVIEGREQALTVILKPGYAPIEQYGSDGEIGQGAWTDLYALASVMYFAIAGRVPPPAVQRVVGVDPCKRLTELAQGRYSDGFLAAIDRALAVQPHDRPQSVAAFRDMLELERTRIRVPLPDISASTDVQSYAQTDAETNQQTRTQGGQPTPARSNEPPAPPVQSGTAAKKSPVPLIAAGVGAVVALAAVGWFMSKGPAPTPASSSAPGSAPAQLASAPPPPATPTPAAMPAASVASIAPPVASATTPVIPTPAATPTPAVVAEFDPARMLSEVVAAADPQVKVEISVPQPRLRIGKDPLNFTVRSSQAGFVYVLQLDTERKHLYLLFPNAIDKKNRIEADKPLKLPRKDWSILVQGPAGSDQFVVMVSEQERSFDGTGLQKSDSIPEFDLAQAKQAFQAQAAGGPLFAGKGGGRYGAAGFEVEEVKK
jgi:serine/threonine protein kinase